MKSFHAPQVDRIPPVALTGGYRMDEQAAADYVRALFLYVLDRKSTSEAEIAHWTAELMAGRDPVQVFRLFTESAENQDRLAALRGNVTKFPPGHFYSPVVNTNEIEGDKQRIFAKRTPASVSLNTTEQLRRWPALSRHFDGMPFAEGPDGKHRYCYGNTSYGFGDACIYWGMLGTLRPSQIVEVGSGFTSALALDGIDYFNLETQCTFIDPYPGLLLKVAAPIGRQHSVVTDRVQNVDPSIVERLRENDLLFIDSSHVVKTGSDVHFEITELLPRLHSGVVVHFHDMFYPLEYPEKWAIDDNYSWNEIYFMHAFLMYNRDFEIIYFNDYVCKMHEEMVVSSLPAAIASRILLNPGGGLWLRRI